MTSTQALHARSNTYPVVISPAGARAFALATDDTNAAYSNGALAPPAYAYVLGAGANFNLYTKILPGYPAVDVIHLAADMRFHAPLVPSSTVYTEAESVGLRRSPRGGLLHFANRVRDESGAVLAESLLTVLVPDLRDEPEWGEAPNEAPNAALRKSRPIARRERVIEPNLPLRWSAACGDFQALHFSDEAAQALGLPRAILHGGCTMALCAVAVVDLAADGDPNRLARLSLRFSQPVFPGSRLLIEVSHPVDVDGGVCHSVRAECDGRPAIRGGRAEVRP